ncbi:hypothetical protein AAVH_43548, partial [Aphelenchoides avenae]
LVVDGSSVYPEGTISSKGASAAVKFLQRYCNWLVVATPSSTSGHDTGVTPRQEPALASLHVVRGGKINKTSARGVPSRGGGGGFQHRGRGNYQNRARGNQQNYVKRHRGFDFL